MVFLNMETVLRVTVASYARPAYLGKSVNIICLYSETFFDPEDLVNNRVTKVTVDKEDLFVKL